MRGMLLLLSIYSWLTRLSQFWTTFFLLIIVFLSKDGFFYVTGAHFDVLRLSDRLKKLLNEQLNKHSLSKFNLAF
jgi:hypothetical protein